MDRFRQHWVSGSILYTWMLGLLIYVVLAKKKPYRYCLYLPSSDWHGCFKFFNGDRSLGPTWLAAAQLNLIHVTQPRIVQILSRVLLTRTWGSCMCCYCGRSRSPARCWSSRGWAGSERWSSTAAERGTWSVRHGSWRLWATRSWARRPGTVPSYQSILLLLSPHL